MNLLRSAVSFLPSALAMAALGVSCQSYAQDVIGLKSGEGIRSKVIAVTQQHIEYKKFENLEGPSYYINTDRVAVINYHNGFREVLDKGFTAQSAVPASGDLSSKPLEDAVKSNGDQLADLKTILKNSTAQELSKLEEVVTLLEANLAAQTKLLEQLQSSQESADAKLTDISEHLSGIQGQLASSEKKENETDWHPAPVGMGTTLSFSGGSYLSGLYLAFSGKSIRFDLEGAAIIGGTPDSEGLNSDHVFLGNAYAGIYGMYQRKRTNIYIGLKIGYEKWTDAYSMGLVPTFGAEFAIDPHFTFGVEEGITLAYGEVNSTDIYALGLAYHRLIIRYYF